MTQMFELIFFFFFFAEVVLYCYGNMLVKTYSQLYLGGFFWLSKIIPLCFSFGGGRVL